MALTYRALSVLLSYPTEALQQAADQIAGVIEFEALLPAPQRAALRGVLDEIASADIYDLQERYVGLFDRGRAVSLHLFEHVHGESRDRGQAMADLVALYESHGLDVAANELPDFLPLFLEFLSLLPVVDASELLREPAAILRALADRLTSRRRLCHGDGRDRSAGAGAARGAVRDPGRGPDRPRLDAAWEDAAVRFGPGEAADGCSTDRLRTRLRAAARDVAA